MEKRNCWKIANNIFHHKLYGNLLKQKWRCLSFRTFPIPKGETSIGKPETPNWDSLNRFKVRLSNVSELESSIKSKIFRKKKSMKYAHKETTDFAIYFMDQIILYSIWKRCPKYAMMSKIWWNTQQTNIEK
jgi:hypothetical protein